MGFIPYTGQDCRGLGWRTRERSGLWSSGADRALTGRSASVKGVASSEELSFVTWPLVGSGKGTDVRALGAGLGMGSVPEAKWQKPALSFAASSLLQLAGICVPWQASV